MTPASEQAISILRDPSQFQWYIIPIFVLVLYVYAVEIEKRNARLICASLAFWGMDWFNEIANGLVLHFTGRSALWTAPGKTAYLIFVGLNIEICLMFAIMGIVLIKMLPFEKSTKVWGIPNRWFFAVFNSVLCVIIEIFLNLTDALVWEYSWWSIPNVLAIIVFGYGSFMVVSFWVYDMERNIDRLKVLGVIYTVDIVAIALFAGVLGWI